MVSDQFLLNHATEFYFFMGKHVRIAHQMFANEKANTRWCATVNGHYGVFDGKLAYKSNTWFNTPHEAYEAAVKCARDGWPYE